MLEIASVNGETGLWVRDGERVVAAIAIDTDGERIFAVYAVVNPDKLQRPGEALRVM
ncbi:RNA polymerase sigma factor SigJ [compost metagenome]